jgi:hypothetical protein
MILYERRVEFTYSTAGIRYSSVRIFRILANDVTYTS